MKQESQSNSNGQAAAGEPSARRAPSGHEEFSAHFKRTHRVLWLIASGVVGDPTLADDVVQEAAIIALGKFGEFSPGTSFAAWMGQVVRNVALNAARRENRRRGVSFHMDGESAIPDRSNPHAPISAADFGRDGRLPADQSWFDDHIVRALGEVGDVARACLLLRTIESMEYSEISAVLSIPEGTAMSHVHRTRRYLRARLTELRRQSPNDARGNA